MSRVLFRALAALVAVAALAGCASVPGHSSVQVLRQVGDQDGALGLDES